MTDTKPVKKDGTTPRPWFFNHACITDEQGTVLFKLSGLVNEKANAALIVEAVNSFDALKQRVKVLEEALGKIAIGRESLTGMKPLGAQDSQAIAKQTLHLAALAPPVGEKEPSKQ